MARGSPSGTVIERWCDAVSSGDLATVKKSVTEDVVFVGPRGTGTGADAVVEWVERSGIQIEPLAISQDGPRYRAECSATWPDPAAPGRTLPAMTTLEFELVDDRLAVIRLFDRPRDQGQD